MTETKSVSVTVELVDAILRYLQTRPYVEVYLLINEIIKQGKPQSSVE